MTEKWDAYDAKLRRIEGRTLVRGEPIPAGVYHLVCDVLVRHEDGTYLLMQRAPGKPFAGMWEASAGGSALQGESPSACAVRELREETGIAAEKVIEVGRAVSEETRSVYVEFLCVTGWEKDRIRLQEGETVAYRWVTGFELSHMTKEELVTKRMQKFLKELRG